MNETAPEIQKQKKETLIALLIFGVLGALFFYPVLFGFLISQSDYLFFVSPWNSIRPDDLMAPANPYIQDQTTEFLAFFMAAKTQIWQGMWPLWNPYILTGTPLLANTQSALLFPLNWGHFILPPGWGFTVSALLKVILAPWFTYLMARRVHLSHWAALIAGVAYGFCAFHVFWLNHPHSNVTLLIPLCFLATENLLARQGIRQVVLLALVTAVSLFAGHVEIAFFTAIACAIYLLVRAIQQGQMQWRLWWQFTAAYVGSLLLAAVLIVPFLEFLTVAAIWDERSADLVYTMPVSAMATAIFADIFILPGWVEHYMGYHISSLYIGVTVLPLLVLAVIKGGRQRTPWLVLLLITLMLAFDIGPLYDVVRHLPVLGHLPMFYWAALIAFSGSLLAGIGWQCCLQGNIKRTFIVWLSLSLVVLVWLTAMFWQGADYPNAVVQLELLKSALQARAWFIMGSLVLITVVMLMARSRSQWPSVIMVLVVFADLWWFNHSWNPTISKEHVFPSETPQSIQFLHHQSGPYRTLGLNHILKPSTNILADLEEVRGYDVPVNLRYHQFFKQALSGTVSFWVYEKTSLQEGIIPYLNSQNVRYIMSKKPLQESFNLPLVYDDEIKIYENPEAEDRLFYRSKADYVDSPEAALTQLLAEPDQLKEQVIIEANSDNMQPSEIESTSDFSFEIVAHNAQKLTAEVSLPNDGWLVHAAAYYPGWRAYVDGEQVPIYAANYIQQGIYLSAGKHRVRFRYEPLSFKIGLLLTLLSFTGVLWILIKNKK
jgi:hypothetical protein